uniref:Uncharacterized protein n=1 Tax=Ixodes ricinus TaxID=34613 RepID=A0A6B0UUM6_IXORI
MATLEMGDGLAQLPSSSVWATGAGGLALLPVTLAERPFFFLLFFFFLGLEEGGTSRNLRGFSPFSSMMALNFSSASLSTSKTFFCCQNSWRAFSSDTSLLIWSAAFLRFLFIWHISQVRSSWRSSSVSASWSEMAKRRLSCSSS